MQDTGLSRLSLGELLLQKLHVVAGYRAYIPVDIISVRAFCGLGFRLGFRLGLGLGISVSVWVRGLGSRGFALLYIIDMGSLLSYESHGKRQHI